MNLNLIYFRLWEIIDSGGDAYYSGPRFIEEIQRINPDQPDYDHFIEERKSNGQSTSRKRFFRDILAELTSSQQADAISAILDTVEHIEPEKVASIRELMIGPSAVPLAEVAAIEVWNGDRLNSMIKEIDDSISAGNFQRAVTLSYTCLEGFYKAFVKTNIPENSEQDITRLSRDIREYLRSSVDEFPDEAFTMINHVSHTIDAARNRFSESHFANNTGRWLAIYSRDLVNSQIRLLLHFM